MAPQVPLRSPPTPSWIHDFPVTQNYAVLPETPVIFNLKVTLSVTALPWKCALPCSHLHAVLYHYDRAAFCVFQRVP